MSAYLPLWWDGLTLVRLVGAAIFTVAWFAVGLLVAPFVFAQFDKATRGYVDWMVETFDRMFMTVSRRACTASIVLSMALFGLAGWWLTSGLPWSWGYHVLRAVIISFLVLGPFGVPVGYRLPRVIVELLWKRRVEKFDEQMLDALAFMSNGLRSGLSLLQSMEMVVEELPDPISQEFGLVLSEQRVGVPFEQALLNLEQRVGTEDLQILVTSINILRQSGGNLTETFDTIAYTVRERKKVQGRIRTLTAQGITQAVIITLMPFFLGFVLWLIDHELISRMWTTWLGWAMIFIMLLLQTIGALIMRKIVQIRV